MRENYQASILLVVLGSTLGGLLFFVARGLLPSVPAPTPPPPDGQPMQAQTLQYEVRTLPKSTVYLLRIPAHSRFRVVPAISDQVDTLETFARRHGAIAVINGGFFDPMNQQSTSYVMQQGTLVADPKQNQRLVNNPNLTPYLEQIFDRSELRRYQCGQGGQGGQGFRYAIARHQAPPLTGCQLVDALGAGPQLLPNTTAVEEGFWATAAGAVIRDSLGSRQANARSAVGMTSDGNLVWVMVAQRTEAPTSSGMSLEELANFMKTLGVEQAINLDGGSSSSLYYQGKTVYGKVNEAGDRIQRSIKSVLLVVGDQKAAGKE